MKLKLNQVTLVAMSSVNIKKTIKALEYSCKGIDFGSVKLITHELPESLPKNIEYNFIKKINNLDKYSYNMIYNLSNYIDTDFALVIQSDGYVINPSCWRKDFLDYDYIGAPFSLPRDNISYRDTHNNIIRVGNGGFSLRSKKLIDIPNKLNLKWKPFHGYYNEDGFICCMYRDTYEKNGCKIAPIDIAKYFSHEARIPEIQGIIPFGFHGKNSVYERF